jgi:hypothetical protein
MTVERKITFAKKSQSLEACIYFVCTRVLRPGAHPYFFKISFVELGVECIRYTPWRWPFKSRNMLQLRMLLIKWWLSDVWLHLSVLWLPLTAVRSSSVRAADVGCICSCEKPQMEDEMVYLLEDALMMVIHKFLLIFCTGFKYPKLAWNRLLIPKTTDMCRKQLKSSFWNCHCCHVHCVLMRTAEVHYKRRANRPF